ncbi:MAG: hypothetical protein A2Z25_15450 [Planctomycetes bacterium RBG_16_55_9]|nr:MAG: hypothetical protein A2Z25_15450 [Planctomycetes bacterium RBG_16_55_9]
MFLTDSSTEFTLSKAERDRNDTGTGWPLLMATRNIFFEPVKLHITTHFRHFGRSDAQMAMYFLTFQP